VQQLSDLRYRLDVDTQLKELCTVNNAKLAFRELLSAWVESSIGSVISLMTRSLGLGLTTTVNNNATGWPN